MNQYLRTLLGITITALVFHGFASAQLTFTGAGVMLQSELSGGYPVVQKVLHFSPAEDAGIQAGEKIWSVDGKSTENKASKDVVAMIKGEAGTKRTLVVGDDKRELELTIRLVKGKCTDGDCLEGEGRIEEPDGNIYRGNFSTGKFNGYGTYYWYKGETMTQRYEGAFLNGIQEGEGVLQDWERRYKLKGNFHNGKLEGSAEVSFMDSDAQYTGNFKEGKPGGAGTLTEKGASKSFQPQSMTDILEAVYGKPREATASTSQNTPARTLTIDDNPGASGRDDLSGMREQMKKVEMSLHKSLDRYADFRSAFHTGLDKGDSDDAEAYAKSAFQNFIDPYGEAGQYLSTMKSTVSSSATISESQHEELQGWTDAILIVLSAYREAEVDGVLSISKMYWNNLNVSRLKEALDKAAAHRHSF